MEEVINKLDQKILDIELDHLKGKISLFPINDLQKRGLKTIKDFQEYNFTPHFERESKIFFYKFQIDHFIKKLNSDPQSFYEFAEKTKKRIADIQLGKLRGKKNLSGLQMQADPPYRPAQKILDIALKDLNETIMGFSLKELQKLKLKTIQDLLDFDLIKYYKNGKANAKQKNISYYFYPYSYVSENNNLINARHFQRILQKRVLSKTKFVEDYWEILFNKEDKDTTDQKILDIPLEKLSEMILLTTVNKLASINIKTVKELMEFDLRKISFSDNMGFIFIQRILELKDKIKNRPENILDFLTRYDLTPDEKKKNDSNLTDLIPETFQDINGNKIPKNEFLSIRFYSFQYRILKFLFVKLYENNIKTIKDLLECKISDLPATIRDDKKFCYEFLKIRNNIINNPAKYNIPLTSTEKNLIAMHEYLAIPDKNDIEKEKIARLGFLKPLPIYPGIPESDGPLAILKTILNDYHERVKKTADEPNFIALYYGIDNPKKNFAEIGKILELSRERCRQRLQDEIIPIGKLLHGEKIRSKVIYIRREAMNILIEPIRYINQSPIHLYKELKNYFTSEHFETFDEEKENLLELFLNALDYRLAKPILNSFIKETLVVHQKKNRNGIFRIFNKLRSIIADQPEGISQYEILKRFGENENDPYCDVLIAALKMLPDIEIYNVSGTTFYRKELSDNKKYTNMAYKILSERGKKMHRNEFNKEIHNRTEGGKYPIQKDIMPLLAQDKRFKPIGKTGYWILAKWKLNTDTQKKLIRKILLKLNRPATFKEIVAKVLEIRPDISIKSLNTLLPDLLLSSKQNMWIIPEWKQRYPDLIFNQKKGKSDPGDLPSLIPIREKIVDLLKNNESGKLTSPEICKLIMLENPTITIQKILKILSSNKYFKKSFVTGKKRFIELK